MNILLKEIIDSIESLKELSILIRNINYNKNLSLKIQSKISPNILKLNVLKQYMKENDLISLTDINTEEFKNWFETNFDKNSFSINLTNNNKDKTIHINISLEKTIDNKELYFVDASTTSLCSSEKRNLFYGPSEHLRDLNSIEDLKNFFFIVKEDFNDLCPICLEEVEKLIKREKNV